MGQRYTVRQWDEAKAVILVFDCKTGFSREFQFADFYDGSVKGGGCPYAEKLPNYVIRAAYKLIDSHKTKRASVSASSEMGRKVAVKTTTIHDLSIQDKAHLSTYHEKIEDLRDCSRGVLGKFGSDPFSKLFLEGALWVEDIAWWNEEVLKDLKKGRELAKEIAEFREFKMITRLESSNDFKQQIALKEGLKLIQADIKSLVWRLENAASRIGEAMTALKESQTEAGAQV